MKLCTFRCAVLLAVLALAGGNRVRPRSSTLPAFISESVRSGATLNASHEETMGSTVVRMVTGAISMPKLRQQASMLSCVSSSMIFPKMFVGFSMLLGGFGVFRCRFR